MYFASILMAFIISLNIFAWYWILGGSIMMYCFLIDWLRKVEQTNKPKNSFKVPFAPYMQCFGMIFNCVLAGGIKGLEWGYFGVWMLMGLCVYFIYSYRNSKLREATSDDGRSYQSNNE